MVKCYAFGAFIRVLAVILLASLSIAFVDAMIKIIFQGINSVPLEIWIILILYPFPSLIFLMAIVTNLQITKDKLSIVGLFRRRELLRNDVCGEYTVVKPPGFLTAYYFAISLNTGKKVKFNVVSEKAKDYVLKFLRGKDLYSDTSEDIYDSS